MTADLPLGQSERTFLNQVTYVVKPCAELHNLEGLFYFILFTFFAT